MIKRYSMFIFVICLLLISSVSYAHSGRTDASGGHKDTKNVSGLGSYHYHCGGYPAHLHPGGVCPYTSNRTAQPTAKPPSATSAPQNTQGKAVQITDSQGNAVTVKALGTVYTQLKQDNKTVAVPTGSLQFSQDSSLTFGSIYAPNTGRASLRQTASDSGNTLLQCNAGAIVYVIAQETDYSLVMYGNEIGYIRNSALTILPGVETSFTEAVLSKNGVTNGKESINIRLTPDGYIIGKFPTGTAIVVIATDGDWCEIEVEGYRGYVMTKFVTMAP